MMEGEKKSWKHKTKKKPSVSLLSLGRNENEIINYNLSKFSKKDIDTLC